MARIDQTVEMGPAGGLESSEQDISETADLSGIQDDVSEEMTAIWGDDVEAARPGMTIKGKRGAIVSERSTLVIQTRGVRQPGEEKPGEYAKRADYDLLDMLGEGGMGVVYTARQASIDRTVAIKMLKLATSKDEAPRRKFLSEAVITGDLDHPHIVPIYDLGTNDEGALFYSMKRVQGTPWDERIYKMSLHENIETLMKVADAVAFGHSRGVVHRDLKPENTMLGEYGEVLVMDWGLAIATSHFKKSKNVCMSKDMGGSPAYMAPEMATGPFEKISYTSDVYLLGAILYEIIAGFPPHTGKDVMKCLVAASKNEIRPTENKGELTDIALKAMSTRPEDRYPSVQDFQNAIRGYLEHTESISLTVGAEEDLEKAEETGDHKVYAKSVFGFEKALELWDGNERADKGLNKAKLAYAQRAFDKGDYDLAASLLDRSVPEHEELYGEIELARHEREAKDRWAKTAKRAVGGLVAVILIVVTVASVWIDHERRIAVEEHKNAVAARDDAERARDDAERARDGEKAQKEIAEQKRKEAEEQRRLAIAAKEAQAYEAYVARIGLAAAKIEENSFAAARDLLATCEKVTPEHCKWEWGRLKFLCDQGEHLDANVPLQAIDVSRDASRIVSGGWRGAVNVWTIGSDEEPVAIQHDAATFVNAVAFSPNGKLVATGSNDATEGYLRLWDADTGDLVKKLEGHNDTVWSVVFSRDGQRLLTSSYDGTARLWDVETARLIRTFEGHYHWVWSAAFSPDEKRIVTSSEDGSAIVWDVDTGKPIGIPFISHRNESGQTPIYCAVFSPDGSLVASGGLDNQVLIWDPEKIEPVGYETDREETDQESGFRRQQVVATLEGHTGAVWSVAFSENGDRVISGSKDNTVKVWSAKTGELIKTLRGHAGWVRSCRFAVAADEISAVSGSHDRSVRLWNIEAYEETRVLGKRWLKGHDDAVQAASFSPNGQRIVTASRDRTARIWDWQRDWEEPSLKLREGHKFMTSTAIFFPNGKRLLTAAADSTVRIWDMESETEILDLRLTGTGVNGVVALSSDGRWVLTGSDPIEQDDEKSVGAAILWDASTGKRLYQTEGQKTEVTAVAISPDNNILFTGFRDGVCILWDRETGKKIRQWVDDQIKAAVFLPDGQRVLTANDYSGVRQWIVATGEEDRSLSLDHPDPVESMALSGDGRLALTSCADGKVRLWDVSSAKLVRELEVRGGKAAFAQNLRRYMNTFHRRDIRWDDGQWAGRFQIKEPLLSSLLMGKAEASPQLAETLASCLEVLPSDLWKTIFSVAISPDGSLGLTVAPDDRIVRLWNLADGSEISFPITSDQPGPFLDLGGSVLRGPVWSAVFSPEGDRVVTVGGDSARLWDLSEGSPAGERELKRFSPPGAVASACFSPDDKYVVTGSWDDTARIWNAENGEADLKLGGNLDQAQGGHQGKVRSAVFSPDGERVLTASDDGTAKIWSRKDGSLIRTLRGHDENKRVLHAAFSHVGDLIVTSSRDATARVWDANTGKQLLVLRSEGDEFAVLQAAFSADDKWIVTGHQDNTAKVWKLDDDEPKPVYTLRGHTAPVSSVAFSPDPDRAQILSEGEEYKPSRVLTGSEDRTAILWDLRDPDDEKELLTLKGHKQGITSVSFSPNGQHILTSSKDGTAIIWLARYLRGTEPNQGAGELAKR